MNIIDTFSNSKILCIGDIMLDEYIYGNVERISPEAPIPVLLVKDEKIQLGGAGNTARNIVALGAQVTFCSIMGNDAASIEMLRLLKEEPRITAYMTLDKHRKTIRKTRYIAGSQQMLRADREMIHWLSQDQEVAFVKLIKQEIIKHEVIVLSDYNKGLLTKTVLQETLRAANDANIPVIVDPKSRSAYYYAGATVITPNAKEFDVLISKEENKSIGERARMDMEGYRIGNILLTRGSEGMTLITPSFTKHIEARAHEVYDVSGAGDTVVATLAVAMASGLLLSDAANLANIAAGIVVGKRGTATVSCNELKEALCNMKNP